MTTEQLLYTFLDVTIISGLTLVVAIIFTYFFPGKRAIENLAIGSCVVTFVGIVGMVFTYGYNEFEISRDFRNRCSNLGGATYWSDDRPQQRVCIEKETLQLIEMEV